MCDCIIYGDHEGTSQQQSKSNRKCAIINSNAMDDVSCSLSEKQLQTENIPTFKWNSEKEIQKTVIVC